MKIKNITAVVLLFIVSLASHGQQAKVQTAIFKVYGNCTQCKDRIETSLDVPGIKSATWNVETKQLQVVYVPAKISIEQMHALIAKSGHDTELNKASDKAYNELPECCLYREHPNTHTDK